MLNVVNISKSYSAQTLLEEISFVVNADERVAFIGPNGYGKSTLLDIIAGDEKPDRGSVSITSGARLGYLRQDLDPEPDETVAQVVRAGLGDWDLCAYLFVGQRTTRSYSCLTLAFQDFPIFWHQATFIIKIDLCILASS